MTTTHEHPEIRLDLERRARIGIEEAIFCPGKAGEHLEAILDDCAARGGKLLLTRMRREQVEQLPARHRERIDYEPVSRTAFYGDVPEPTAPSQVAIVAAGTSDAFVFREIARTLKYNGEASTMFVDVGLAGLWRLLGQVEAIRQHPVVIVVAGMDAALPTVVGGLVQGVCMAVPTSNGYGAANGGESALRAVLASCSPGVTVLNIDNGYGAACAAVRVIRLLGRAG